MIGGSNFKLLWIDKHIEVLPIIHGSFFIANRDNIYETVPSGFMLFQGPIFLNIVTFPLKKVL